MFFRKYGVAKRGLDKYLKRAISQYPLTSNMVKVPKHLSNYDCGAFIILIDYR